MVVSELVTNAVQAGTTVLRVSVEWRCNGICISVYDVAEGCRRPMRPAGTRRHGRGLAVVQTLGSACGFRRSGSIGK